MTSVSGLDRRLILKLGAAVVLALFAIGALVVIARSSFNVSKPVAGTSSHVSADPPPSDNTNKNAITSLLRQVYSDGTRTADEEVKVRELSTGLKVDPHWVTSQEREITDRVEQAAPFSKRGLLYSSRESYDLAVKEFRRGLEIYDGNAVLWANLGAAYIKLNDLASARSACDRALGLDPQNWVAHYNLGAIHANEGNQDAAVFELSEALRLIEADRTQLVTKRQAEALMRSDGSLDSLRSDLRFKNLLARNR